MAEIAEESQYAGAWGNQPVRSAHNTAGLYLVVAEDHIASISQLIAKEGGGIFGPPVLARAALELLARSYWLAEPGIGCRRRIARGQTERLHSSYQLRRLSKSLTEVAEVEAGIIHEANGQGFKVISGKNVPHRHIEESRPSGAAAMRHLFGDDPDPEGAGHLAWGSLSGVIHGALYALLQGAEPTPSSIGGAMARLRVSAREVNLLIAMLNLGFGNAFLRYAGPNGWEVDAWARNWRNTISVTRAYCLPPKDGGH